MDVAATSRGAGVSAVVEYDYTAKEPDELDLVKGAIIHSIKQMPGGWWEGTLQANGKTGMFPDNFVRVVDTNDDNAVILRDKSAASNRRCKVIYSYTQVNDDELSLGVGDVIEFLGEVEEGWWRGRLKTKVGVFPSNFVIAIEPSPILASKRPPSTKIVVPNNASTLAASAAAITSARRMNRLGFNSSKEDLLAAASSNSAALATEVAPSLPPKPQREYCRVEFPYAPQNDDELELKVGDIIAVVSMELPDKGWWKGELRGKVGVFPDNFVKLLAPSEVSPLNEPQHTQRTAKQQHSNVASSTTSSSMAAHTSTSNLTTSVNSHSNTTAPTTKVFIKKSGSSSSSTHSSNRKDSFGSRDSLNDILSETGLPSGNVAAQRKSLENKNLDLTNAPDASTRLGLKKQQLSNNITTTTTTTAMATSSSSLSTNELRKSMESLDDKTKSPPPVLTKKPSVPTKKGTTVTSVAGNLLSGLKQKVKNVENKLTTSASHDYADGVGSSKMSPLPDSAPSGNVVMRRAATIAVEDSDFDRVERASILPDMRAGRVKAPKRRPPSAAINVIGESNNNNSIYLNGSGGSVELLQAGDDGKTASSDDNSTGEEQLAKPKPREWEKKKAPWMEELKASQVKKKTSPNVEPRSTVKLPPADETKISNNHTSSSVSVMSSSSTAANASSSSSVTTKVQSTSVSSSLMQSSVTATESSQQVHKKEYSSASSTSGADAVSKSLLSAKSTANDGASSVTSVDDVRARPNSLSIRNRSISPSLAGGGRLKTSGSTEAGSSNATGTASTTVTSSVAKTTTLTNNLHNNTAEHNSSSAGEGGGARVMELERRVDKLESVVQAQQRTIEELVRSLREETDRVKLLRGELDKYAQCVTQV